MRVVFISFPYFIEEGTALLAPVAEVTGIDIAYWRTLSLKERLKLTRGADVVHFYWGRFKWFESLALRWNGSRVVVHLIGTDVLRLLEASPRKRVEARMLACWTRFAAVSPNLVNEVAGMGLRADLVPFVSGKVNRNAEQVRWPSAPRFRFLCYVPQKRLEFYGWSKILFLARSFPSVEFWILSLTADAVQEIVPENVKLLGWRDDIVTILGQVHALLRPTAHDGLPNMVVEAMSYGRYVIFSGELPGTLHASSLEELSSAVREIMARQEPDWAGFEYVMKNFSKKQLLDGFLQLYGIDPAPPWPGQTA